MSGAMAAAYATIASPSFPGRLQIPHCGMTHDEHGAASMDETAIRMQLVHRFLTVVLGECGIALKNHSRRDGSNKVRAEIHEVSKACSHVLHRGGTTASNEQAGRLLDVAAIVRYRLCPFPRYQVSGVEDMEVTLQALPVLSPSTAMESVGALASSALERADYLRVEPPVETEPPCRAL